jgi:hypothetical protein
MRFLKIAVDYWTLVASEERYRSAPETFLIPSLEFGEIS